MGTLQYVNIVTNDICSIFNYYNEKIPSPEKIGWKKIRTFFFPTKERKHVARKSEML